MKKKQEKHKKFILTVTIVVILFIIGTVLLQLDLSNRINGIEDKLPYEVCTTEIVTEKLVIDGGGTWLDFPFETDIVCEDGVEISVYEVLDKKTIWQYYQEDGKTCLITYQKTDCHWEFMGREISLSDSQKNGTLNVTKETINYGIDWENLGIDIKLKDNLDSVTVINNFTGEYEEVLKLSLIERENKPSVRISLYDNSIEFFDNGSVIHNGTEITDGIDTNFVCKFYDIFDYIDKRCDV